MLSRLFEWYRAVNPQPESGVIEKRRLAIQDIIARLVEAEKPELLIACVAAAIDGLERRFRPDSDLVAIITDAIRSHQAAFPSDLVENSLELRICTMVALGEIVSRRESDGAVSDDAQLAGMLLKSAFGLRPLPPERFLRIALQELSDASRMTMASAAEMERLRQAVDYQPLRKLPTEPAEAVTKMATWLIDTVKRLDGQSRADREELEVLWWAYNGYSETVHRPIKELPAGQAAICAGSELARRVQVPPPTNTPYLVSQAVQRGRKKPDLVAKPLSQIANTWGPPLWQLLIPSQSEVQTLVGQYPTLFPLSWICRRFQDSEGATQWEAEFNTKTGLDGSQAYTADQVAIQVFNEAVAQRMCDAPLM